MAAALRPRLGIATPVAAALAMALLAATPARSIAAMSVIENRTDGPLRIVATAADRPEKQLILQPGDARPLFHYGEVRVRATLGGSHVKKRLTAGNAYVVERSDGAEPLAIRKLNLGTSPPVGVATPGSRPHPGAGEITVKIVVDDDEVRRKPIWESTIRERIARASDILTEHSGIRLRVVAVEAWDSADQQFDFHKSMREFEQEVRPHPAQVAIGFSSQYRIERGRYHMGGTRASLHSHILLKERARNVLEPERLELLVHELGHFLGATHSAEATSVMRPVIKESPQRSAGAKVRFDAANTLLLALMGEEICFRGVKNISELRPDTRRRMAQIYAALQPRLPNDPAAGQYRRLLATSAVNPLLTDAQAIRTAVVEAATQATTGTSATNAAKGEIGIHAPNVQAASSAAMSPPNDKLLELYVRTAARTAERLDKPHAPQAFLLALGVALDDSSALAKFPVAKAVCNRIESPSQQRERLEVIGRPTLRGRNDLAKHFFVSASITAMAGSQTAGSVGLAKEMLDSTGGGSGFSFADMAANRAGILFAQAVLTRQVSLSQIAEEFTAQEFLPPVDDLRESLGAAQVIHEFGAGTRLQGELKRIEARIAALPVYRTSTTAEQEP